MSKWDVFHSHKMRGSETHELTSLIDCIRDIEVGYGKHSEGLQECYGK